MSQLGDAIRDHRLSQRLSQADLGRIVGVSRVSVGAWERGESMPTEENLARMAALFHVPESQLRYPNDAPHYALSEEQLQRIPGYDGALLQMSDEALALVSPLLGQMVLARVSKAGRDHAEAFLTQLATGAFTPGHPLADGHTEADDVRHAVRFLRDLYQRRGITLVGHETPMTEDPDAMTGAEFVAQLSERKRKPKAG